MRTTQAASLLTLGLAIASASSMTGCSSISGEGWSSRQQKAAQPSLFTSLGITGPLPVDVDKPAMRESALHILQHAIPSPNAELRAVAIQALHYAPSELEPAVLAGLGDENRAVRFIAAMTVGKFKMRTVSHLVSPLLNDDSESVRAAAIYALERCGESVDVNPLGQMLLSPEPEVKANAAMVLGELGNPTAVPMLRSAAGKGLTRAHVTHAQLVDLQIAEAVVKLGEERELDVIRASLFAPAEKAEIVALACLMCGRLNDGRAVPNLEDLALREGQHRLPAEVRMAATLALAQIKSGRPRIEVPLEYATSDRFELRLQSAMTLGAIKTPPSLNALRQLLADSNPLVQVAAAAGVLQHLGERDVREPGV